MTKKELEAMLLEALQGLEEMKGLAIEADKKRLSAMNPIMPEYKALPTGEAGKAVQPARRHYSPPERKATLQGQKLQDFVAFCRTAIKGLHAFDVQKGYGRSAGIHSVYSGFNDLVKEEYGIDCYQTTAELEAVGFGIKPTKGGVMIYLPEDAKNMAKKSATNKTAKLRALLGL